MLVAAFDCAAHPLVQRYSRSAIRGIVRFDRFTCLTTATAPGSARLPRGSHRLDVGAQPARAQYFLLLGLRVRDLPSNRSATPLHAGGSAAVSASAESRCSLAARL